jgi:hypothetical protein
MPGSWYTVHPLGQDSHETAKLKDPSLHWSWGRGGVMVEEENHAFHFISTELAYRMELAGRVGQVCGSS